jgi:hypothetical protein
VKRRKWKVAGRVFFVLLGFGLAAEGARSADPPQALTPEYLAMPRTSMAFINDRTVRLFNGRGAISIRDKSVTGLQELLFPPITARDYRFQLAFREKVSNVLIQDVVPDVYDYMVQTGKGPHPLGLNFQSPGAPFVMILQEAHWQPATYLRTGTFHKKFGEHWVSFGMETKTLVSAATDEIYLEARIENRQPAPLLLTVAPEQRAPELAAPIPGEKLEDPGPATQMDVFTLANSQVRITAVSDLPESTKEGWVWEVPARGSSTARFAIVPQLVKTPAPGVHSSDIAQRMERAERALRDRLRWAEEKLPRITTENREFDDFYRRSILSVLESRWDRENFVARPFYAVGTWVFTIPWDTSYASEMLAILDPEGLKEAFLTYIRAGLLRSSYVPWNGKAGEYWYAQNPFAEMRILLDYLRQTGDMAFLDHQEEGATVFEWMKRMGRELVKRYARPDGLLDFGEGSGKMLELRTDGYQHVVAASNGMAAEYFRQVAAWCHERRDPEGAQFEKWATQLTKSLQEKMWNEEAGWFDNLYPDGSRHQVWSYHLFDILEAEFLSEAQRRRLISHLAEGEFLGPYGMYSVSKVDRIHWDLEDVDWGGGGQYAGMPLRVAESLYRLGYPELGWNVLARCLPWARAYPYLPQEIFADFLRSPEVVEMPLEISGGSGVHAILFGVFGLRPQLDGSLTIAPAYHHELGTARLSGYHYRGHTYDVVLEPLHYTVLRDGEPVAQKSYGQPSQFPRP